MNNIFSCEFETDSATSRIFVCLSSTRRYVLQQSSVILLFLRKIVMNPILPWLNPIDAALCSFGTNLVLTIFLLTISLYLIIYLRTIVGDLILSHKYNMASNRIRLVLSWLSCSRLHGTSPTKNDLSASLTYSRNFSFLIDVSKSHISCVI